MTRAGFTEELEKRGYEWREEGDTIVVGGDSNIHLEDMKEIPSGVIFEADGHVWLGVKRIPPGVRFANSLGVSMVNLESVSSDVRFDNSGEIIRFGKTLMIHSWEGRIEGISPGRLLNAMVSDGTFDRG